MTINRTLVVIIAILAILSFYLIPTGIALLRRHESTALIFLFNFLLGWTGLGLAIAFVWSFISAPKEPEESEAQEAAPDTQRPGE